jgi:hypothetical protein
MIRKWKNAERWSVVRQDGRRAALLFNIRRKPDGELTAIPKRCALSAGDLIDVATFMQDAREMRRRLEAHFAEDRTEIWDGE